jgi:ornithine cyclodeaminase
MLIVEEDLVTRLLPMESCIDLMRETLRELVSGRFSQPPRSVHKLPGGDLFGFMPAYLGGRGYFGAKVVTAFHGNLAVGLPSHRGYVMLFEAAHGGLEAMVDATSITRIRTGAVSAVATELLSRQDAQSLALVGAGAQAHSHLEAIRLVRKITSVRIFDLDAAKAQAFAREAEARYSIPVAAAPTIEETVNGADIICTLTPSAEPFLELGMVKAGAHINAVGAFSPDKREICSSLVAASRLYADQTEAMKRECGEYLIPVREGLIDERHIIGSIGELLLGAAPGRGAPDQITLFDALGLAVEDVACARFVYEAAR